MIGKEKIQRLSINVALFLFFVYACQKGSLPTFEPILKPISQTEISTNIDESPTLKIQFRDLTGKVNNQRQISWISSDPNVVSVGVSTGKLTPLKPGTATITASVVTLSGAILKTEFIVTVPLEVNLVIKPNTGDTPTLIGSPVSTRLTYEFTDQTDTKLEPSSTKWSIAPEDNPVFTIDQTGVISPLKPGVGTATLDVVYQGKSYKQTIQIEIVQKPEIRIINPNSEVVVENQSIQPLEVIFTNEKGKEDLPDEGSIQWESSNQDILQVESETGALSPLKPGIATISVRFEVGEVEYSQEISIDVTQEVQIKLPPIEEGIRINGNDIQLGTIEFVNNKGKKESPDSFCWESSDPQILKIDCQGKITPIKPGRVILTLKITDDGKEFIRSSQEVTLTQDPTIEIVFPNQSPLTLIHTTQQDLKLEYVFTDQHGEKISPQSAKWESDNTESLEINQNGILKPIKADRVKITLTAYQNDSPVAQTEWNIQIQQPPKVVIANPPDEVSTLVQHNTPLEVQYTNQDGQVVTPQEIIWKSDHQQILEIDEQGKLKALKEGQATIRVQIGEDGPEDTHVISVIEEYDPVLELNQISQTLIRGQTITIDYVYYDKTGEPANPKPDGIWSNSHPDILELNESTGEITARSIGTSTISIAVENLSQEITITVEVEPQFHLDFPSAPLQLGIDTHDLNLRFTDERNQDITDSREISYGGYDKTIVRISDAEVITPIVEGTTTIEIKTTYKEKPYLKKISIEVVSLTIKTIPELEVGDRHDLEVNFTDEDGYTSSPKAEWSSNYFSIRGEKFNPYSPGFEKSITAKYTYKGGTYTATSRATVTTPVALEIDSFDQVIIVPQNNNPTRTLYATLTDQYGEAISNVDIYWYSEDTNVATINDDGELTAQSSGTTQITATASFDGQDYESTPKGITIIQPIVNLKGGSSRGLLVGKELSFDYSFTDGYRGSRLTPSKVIWSNNAPDGHITLSQVGTYQVSVVLEYEDYHYEDSRRLKVRDLRIIRKPSNDEATVGGTNPNLDFQFINEDNDVVSSVSAYWKLKNRSNSSVLDIDQNTGKITPLSAGTATVILTVNYDNVAYNIEYQLTINAPAVPEIDLDSSEYELSDFVWKAMNFWYLWQNDISLLTDSRGNNESAYKQLIKANPNPRSFFSKMKHSNDKYSWYVNDYEELEKTQRAISYDHGMDYVPICFRGSNKCLGVVIYVAAGSSAGRAGLKRGDIFDRVNGIELTRSNYRIADGSSLALSLVDVTYNPGDNTISITDLLKTININKQDFQRDPIMAQSIITKGSHSIGYLAYEQFTSDATALNTEFGKFSGQITDFVLDLRYNRGGFISTAQALATMISGRGSSDIFAIEEWGDKVNRILLNSKGGRENIIDRFLGNSFNNGVSINKLSNLNTLYVLTGSQTASASELIINALRPYLNVVLIGEKTVGKNVGSLLLYDLNSFNQDSWPFLKNSGDVNPNHRNAIQLITLRIANANEESDYTSGFSPDYKIDEISNYWHSLGSLGQEGEPLLDKAIELITGIKQRKPIPDSMGAEVIYSEPVEGMLIKTLDDLKFKNQ